MSQSVRRPDVALSALFTEELDELVQPGHQAQLMPHQSPWPKEGAVVCEGTNWCHTNQESEFAEQAGSVVTHALGIFQGMVDLLSDARIGIVLSDKISIIHHVRIYWKWLASVIQCVC